MSVTFNKLPVQFSDIRAPGPLPLFNGTYPSHQKQFLSAQQTGTGASQNVAHGLGLTPAGVLVSCTDNSSSANIFTVVEGTHDATNVKVTVTSGAKFKVLAFL